MCTFLDFRLISQSNMIEILLRQFKYLVHLEKRIKLARKFRKKKMENLYLRVYESEFLSLTLNNYSFVSIII